MSKGFCRGLATTALAVALQGSPGFAAAPNEAAAASVPTAETSDTGIAIEPQATKASTGAAEQKGALRMVVVLPAVRAALSRSSTGLREEQLPGPAGGIGIDLQGRFQSAVVARRSADGILSFVCTEDDLEVLATPAITVTAPGVKP